MATLAEKQPGIRRGDLLRLRPFDTSTEAGRADERHRRALLASASSLIARALLIGSAFVSVPLTIKYLGTERYGMWMTITSLAGMLAFADFGMGNGLLSSIASASGRDDKESAARSVTSALAMLGGIALLTICALAVSFPLVRWAGLLNMKSPMGIAEAGPAAAIFIICFALNLPLGVVQRIQMAYQETFQSNLWQIMGSVGAFAGLLIAIHLRAGLPWLIAAFSGIPTLVCAINLFVQLKFDRPWLAPRRQYFDFAISRQLAGRGFIFVAIALANSVAFYADNFIIAHLLGPAEVARYSVGVRLFSLVSLLPQILFNPLWPAYSEAFARGDMLWVRATLKRTALLGLAITVGTGLCVLFLAPWFVQRWARGMVTLPFGLCVALFLSVAVVYSTFAHNILFLGLNSLKVPAITMILVAISSVIVKVMIIPSVGVAGAAWATAGCYLVFGTLPMLYFAHRLLAQKCPVL